MRVGSLVVACVVIVLLLAGANVHSSGSPTTGPATGATPAVHTAAQASGHHEDHPDPGVQPSFKFFPGHGTVVASLEAHQDHPWVTLHTLGVSHDDRPILLAEVTDPDAATPLDARTITLILTQQHGNEPAGTPAALDLLDRIADGDPIAETLDDQVLLLLPMANPDGASANQRRNAQDRDINRDHISLHTPEAGIIHEVLLRWDVHVAMDHHEYGGTGLGHPSPVRLYDYDLTTLFPVHDNVRTVARDAAQDLMYEGIWPAAEEDGYSANEYGEVTVHGEPVDQVAGGPDPGIMRNHLGLHHIAGILVETFVGAVENPMHDAERRTAIHTSVMDATLEYVDAHAERFRTAKADAAQAEIDDPWPDYVQGERKAPLPDGFRLDANATRVLETLGRHGLPNATVPAEDGAAPVVDVRHGLRSHAAAALHPESSRSLDETTPVDLPALESQFAPDAVKEGTAPGPVLLIGMLLVGLAALMTARRRP